MLDNKIKKAIKKAAEELNMCTIHRGTSAGIIEKIIDKHITPHLRLDIELPATVEEMGMGYTHFDVICDKKGIVSVNKLVNFINNNAVEYKNAR